MRINARLDEEHSRRLKYLSGMSGESVSAVLKQAIDCYYEASLRRRGSAEEILAKTGFIGVAEGDPELSVRYKDARDLSPVT